MDEPAWADEDAGPIVRPYALTGGRTRDDLGGRLDLLDLVETTGEEPERKADLGPEHLRIRRLTAEPLSVAEVAADLDLPLDVVRVLLGDLLRHGLVRLRKPASVSRLTDARLLKEVIDGLSAL
ncbi:DUF742 domain-containing protein [Actinocorallia populi]|uniref:DUF742 domain-containing protein n=1 Tax=Actinocorallia populi TaxID=2079200 RepID=UPI000D08E97C|nr:DUF742 domain-containing protein [Actinocorallia populi]